MTINAEQRELRKKYYGSSDVASIFNCTPYGSPLKVYLQKTGQEIGDESGLDYEYGNLMEPGLIRLVENYDGILKISESNVSYFGQDGLSISHPDGLAWFFDDVHDWHPCNIEAKAIGPYSREKDQFNFEAGLFPDRIMLQVQHSMYCTGNKLALVPVHVYGLGSWIYEVPRDDKKIEIILEVIKNFHEQYVIPRKSPEVGENDSVSTLLGMQREEGKVFDDDVAGWHMTCMDEYRQAIKQLKEKYEENKKILVELMGDASIARGLDYEYRISRQNFRHFNKNLIRSSLTARLGQKEGESIYNSAFEIREKIVPKLINLKEMDDDQTANESEQSD